jgi:hypothetical protein
MLTDLQKCYHNYVYRVNEGGKLVIHLTFIADKNVHTVMENL